MNKDKFYIQLKAEEKELEETLQAIRVLLKRYESSDDNYSLTFRGDRNSGF